MCTLFLFHKLRAETERLCLHSTLTIRSLDLVEMNSFAAIKDVLEKGEIILPLDYYATNGKKQMTGMMAAPIVIGTDSFICVVVVIYNLQEKRLYLHECFLTEKIPEIAASSLVRGSSAASPQSQGSVAKILQKVLNIK